MKKSIFAIIVTTVILGGCGNYTATSEPLPYESDASTNSVEDVTNTNNEDQSDNTSEIEVENLTDGVFETVGEGFNGDVVVETTIENGKIANIEILSHDETDGISDEAINDLPASIIENNSVNVDGASGATYTSDAIKSAVEAAMEEAGGN